MPKHQRSRANTMCMAHLWQCQWHFTCTTDIITMAIIIAFSGSQQCRGPWPWLFFSVGAKFNTFGFKSQDMRRCQGLALKKREGMRLESVTQAHNKLRPTRCFLLYINYNGTTHWKTNSRHTRKIPFHSGNVQHFYQLV